MAKGIIDAVIGRYGIAIAISIVLFLSIFDIFFVSFSLSRKEILAKVGTENVCRSFGDEIGSDIPKISQIEDPSITPKAAFSSCRTENIPVCKDLNSKVWIFLLVSFIFLLVFNLGYGLFKNEKIQWIWEAVMMGIFLSFWFIFDACAQNIWYPLYITKLGIAIYIAYLYFFFKKKQN